MGDKSAIEWCDASWNPVTGCSHVSDGCTHCYAEALSLRMGWSKHPWGAQWAAENVVLHPERLDQPLRWKRPRRIFVNSMSDLFHERVPFEFILRVFHTMSLAIRHTFQILTKRPERMLAFFRWWEENQESIWTGAIARRLGFSLPFRFYQNPWPWVWLGISVEDQRRADERIPLLLQTPAAVRFLSCEPLLEPIDLNQWLDVNDQIWVEKPEPHSEDGWHLKPHPITGIVDWYPGIDWVIVGGESAGPPERRLVHHPVLGGWPPALDTGTWVPIPEKLAWVRSLRDQCQAAGVAFLFKQWGGRTPKAGGRMLDGREWNEYPDSASALQLAVPR